MRFAIAAIRTTPRGSDSDGVYETHPYDIIGIGASTVDRFILVDSFPAGREVQEARATAVDGGGPVATALAVAGKYGVEVAMIDRVGDDYDGAQVFDDFDKYCVDTRFIDVVPDGKTANATILVDKNTGNRAVFFERSTIPEFVDPDERFECIRESHILHINGRHRGVLPHAMGLCKTNGGIVSLDGGANRYDEGMYDITRASDIVIAARDYAERYTGVSDPETACRIIHDRGAYIAGVTDGADGSYFVWPDGESYRVPAFPQDHIVDTTGCGDSFHGAFLTVIAKAVRFIRTDEQSGRCAREVLVTLDRPILESAADFASAVASLNTRSIGGRSGLPTLETALALANSRKKSL